MGNPHHATIHGDTSVEIGPDPKIELRAKHVALGGYHTVLIYTDSDGKTSYYEGDAEKLREGIPSQRCGTIYGELKAYGPLTGGDWSGYTDRFSLLRVLQFKEKIRASGLFQIKSMVGRFVIIPSVLTVIL